MRPAICLIEHVGLALIIEYPSGVEYSNQTGGGSCLAPSLEGVVVPLANDVLEETRELVSPENALFGYFKGPKWRGTGATNGIDLEDVAFIENALGKLGQCIRIDRDRLRESHEAWVWVFVTADESRFVPIFSGFAPYPRRGVLTWSNTD